MRPAASMQTALLDLHPLVDQQGRQGLSLLVEAEHGRQVLVGDHVAVLHQQRLLALEERGHFLRSARRAQQLRLVGIGQLQPPAGAVGKMVANDLGHEMQVDGNLVEAMPLEVAEDVLQHRPIAQGEHRLGDLAGQVAQAGAVAGTKNHRFHGCVRIHLAAA